MRTLSQKVKLLVDWSIFVPILNYCRKIWVLTERIVLQIQVVEPSFLWKVAGLTHSQDEEPDHPESLEQNSCFSTSAESAEEVRSCRLVASHVQLGGGRGRPRKFWRDFIFIYPLWPGETLGSPGAGELWREGCLGFPPGPVAFATRPDQDG